MAGFFDRFKRGRRGGRGARRGRGARTGRDARPRSAEQATDMVTTGPPPQQVAPPLGQPPPPQPVRAPAAPPLRPAPQAAPPAPAPAADSGATRMVRVGAPSRAGVVGVLIGVHGKLKDEVFKVFDGDNTVGRQPTAQVYLGEADDSISREHAQIIHREGAFGLKPLKENNPTYLNGEVVDGGAPLSDGDEIGLGDSKLRFRVV
jgi:pSer/pThr/pTyr-binding forkhead associated (FHA) protein